LLFLISAAISVSRALFAACVVCARFGYGGLILLLLLLLLILLPLVLILILLLRLLLLILLSLVLCRLLLRGGILLRSLGLLHLSCICLLLGLLVGTAVMRTVMLTALAGACLGRFIVLLVVFHVIYLLNVYQSMPALRNISQRTMRTLAL